MNMIQMTVMMDYARSLLGTPYIWGGQSAAGCDCSGFALMLLNVVGKKPKSDHTAQGIYEHLKNEKTPTPKRGEFFFYGKSLDKITHVAFHVGGGFVIEAGGAGSGCDTPQKAFAQSACVRIVSDRLRSDFLCACEVPD